MSEPLDTWHVATTAAGAFGATPPTAANLEWREARLPLYGSDSQDHWFRQAFDASGAAPVLYFGGLASICDVYLDGSLELRSESMFLAHELPVAAGAHELAVCARALEPIISVPRKPRARWRSKVPRENSLRWVRTSLLGRSPGFAPGPPVVGPWRPVQLLGRPRLKASFRPRLEGHNGVLEVRCDASAGELEITLDSATSSLPPGGGSVRLHQAERWWPHTHGRPRLYRVELRSDDAELSREIGFRELVGPTSFDEQGLALQINDVPIFARGAVWTPVPDAELRSSLESLRDAGLNIIRVAGTTVYESSRFHDLCDELGLLVWQDLMFANMDYPVSDPAFRGLVEAEIRQALEEVAGRPSLAVVCGNSEVEQQVGMLGLDPTLARGELFGALIPALMLDADMDAVYVPSAPTGGEQPFRTDRGVANYFGVGAYLRPLEDARRASVRFASECLAFANVPDADPMDHVEGVMRDVGADWDFAEVRDHYLKLLHGISRDDPDYWERSRFVTGEVMAEVFGEWRRAASASNGGIVLWSRDLVPGAGWGLLDSRGDSKVVWHYLRRALAPVTVWTIDEGLNGVSIHVANDSPEPVRATLRVALYRDSEVCVEDGHEILELAPHTALERCAEGVLGRFVDVAYAYRFGPPQHDLIVTSLETADDLLSQDFRFPVGRPRARVSAEELGLEGQASALACGAIAVSLGSGRLVYGARLSAPGYLPADDAFSIEPGHSKLTLMRPRTPVAAAATVRVSALNLSGPLEMRVS